MAVKRFFTFAESELSRGSSVYAWLSSSRSPSLVFEPEISAAVLEELPEKELMQASPPSLEGTIGWSCPQVNNTTGQTDNAISTSSNNQLPHAPRVFLGCGRTSSGEGSDSSSGLSSRQQPCIHGSGDSQSGHHNVLGSALSTSAWTGYIRCV